VSLDPLIISMLAPFAEDASNHIYILSGETRDKIEKLFGNLNVGLIAEYGAFFRPIPSLSKESGWQNKSSSFDHFWREPVLNWLQAFQETTPGSFIEEREVLLAIHFPPSNGDSHCCKMKNQLLTYLQGSPKLPVVPIVLHSKNYYSIIITPQGIDTANIIKEILDSTDYDFVFCYGNDRIHQATFVELPKHSISYLFSATNQRKTTSASYCVRNGQSILKIISSFINKPLREGRSSCQMI